MLNKKKNNKGFTLVELLVVIAIIGILAVVAVPALFKNIEKSKVADLTADINAIRSASLSYYSDENAYPVDGTELVAGLGVLEGELENISNPFNANTYTLNGTTPGDLTLTIDFSDDAQLSNNAIEKLEQSLGDLATTVEADSVVVTLIKSGN